MSDSIIINPGCDIHEQYVIYLNCVSKLIKLTFSRRVIIILQLEKTLLFMMDSESELHCLVLTSFRLGLHPWTQVQLLIVTKGYVALTLLQHSSLSVLFLIPKLSLIAPSLLVTIVILRPLINNQPSCSLCVCSWFDHSIRI